MWITKIETDKMNFSARKTVESLSQNRYCTVVTLYMWTQAVINGHLVFFLSIYLSIYLSIQPGHLKSQILASPLSVHIANLWHG